LANTENCTRCACFPWSCKLFRKYIQGFAKLAAPLTNLLRNLGPSEALKARRLKRLPHHKLDALYSQFAVKWTPACQTSFEGLKTVLSSEPVLRLPDFDKPFEVVADACTSTPAIGAVLMQSVHPVAFYSRKCIGTESNYSASDLEMLAVIAALKEWRPDLQGGPRFKIVTDHLLNTYVDSASVSSYTLQCRARWLEISSCYDYEWEYRPGRLNVADPISRAPAHFHSAAAAAVVLQAAVAMPHPVGQLVSRPGVASSGSANPGSRALVARLRLALPTRTVLLRSVCAAATRSRTRTAAAPAPVATPPADDGPQTFSGGDDAPVQGEVPDADTATSDDEGCSTVHIGKFHLAYSERL
jgi:RNase H-like domain found in reverse transcriptase